MIDAISYLNGLTKTESDEDARAASSELGKDAFMQLLVNQMAYQDPLEPMDNSEFLGQLAQFSSLEQMQNVASAVEMLALSQAASTNSQMVNLIGKRVVVPGSTFSVDSTKTDPIALQYNVEENAKAAELVISDSKGNVVRRIELQDVEAGMNTVKFDGKDSSGNQLESGTYTYKILDQSGKTASGVTTYSNYIVDAVAFSGTDIILKSGDIEIAVSDITEVINN